MLIHGVYLEKHPAYWKLSISYESLRYFGHLRLTAGSLKKTLRLGKIEGRKRRG